MDISSLGSQADLISLSGHKVYGPKGIGALFIRRDMQDRIEPIIHGGGQQAGLRSGTIPTPLCVGMAAAVDIVRSTEGPEERTRIAGQRDAFVRLVREGFPAVAINGPAGEQRHPGNANLRFDGLVAQDILGSLQPHLAASSGSGLYIRHPGIIPRASCSWTKHSGSGSLLFVSVLAVSLLM